jgi:hypothetical protein
VKLVAALENKEEKLEVNEGPSVVAIKFELEIKEETVENIENFLCFYQEIYY